MKVYGGTVFLPRGWPDVGTHHRQATCIVAAMSGAEARRVLLAHGLRVTPTEWKQYWGETGNALALEAVEPGAVFVRRMAGNEPFVRVATS